MKEQRKGLFKKKIPRLKVLVIVLIALTIIFWIGNSNRVQNQTYNEFVWKEKEISSFSWLLEDLSNECAERGEYDKMLSKDTRDMSISELERFVALDPECSPQIPLLVASTRGTSKRNKQISELFGFVAKMPKGEKKELAEKITTIWRDISSLQEEGDQLRLGDYDAIFYIEAELEYKQNKMTLESRNDKFKEFNKSKEERLKKSQEVWAKERELENKKEDLLAQFKALIGK